MRKLFVVEMNAFQNLLLAFDFHLGINGSQMLFNSGDADEEGGRYLMEYPRSKRLKTLTSRFVREKSRLIWERVRSIT